MILATAGHVDHGKSTLVRLLTGTDPDRWAEERRRGLTIDLGFAVGKLPGGGVLSMVDVPGHRRFGANMAAGAHGADAVLFVVSAAEGWMPQSEEHLMVLDAFGARGGVVALTHADRVDPGQCARVADEVRGRLAGTFLEGAPLVPTDGRAAGVVALAEALESVIDGLEPSTDERRPRLWVDRSFVIEGRGRVVTGTLTGGSLSEGDELAGSAGRLHRIRSLHVDGRPGTVAPVGTRVALRLSGDTSGLGRGDALVRSGDWQSGSVLHVEVTPFRGRAVPAERRGWTLVAGTGRWPVELRRPAAAPPGIARLHAEHEVGPLAPGDRFVLHDSGGAESVAGGLVLAVGGRGRYPAVGSLSARRDALHAPDDPGALGRAVFAEYGGAVPAAELRSVAGPAAREASGVVVVDGVALDAAAARRHSAIGRNPRRDDADRLDAARDTLLRLGDGVPVDRAALAGAGVGRRALTELAEAGEVVELGGDLVAPAALVDRWRAQVVARLRRGPASLAELRDVLGLSRRQALAVCEWTDRAGITQRNDEHRELADRSVLPASRSAQR